MSLDRYLNGDDSALDEAIVECMPLVDEVATSFAKKHKQLHLLDDLKSEGYLALMSDLPLVQAAKQGSADLNPSACLVRKLTARFVRAVIPEQNLGMSQSTRQRRKAGDEEIPTVHSNLNDYEAFHDPTAVIDLRMTIEDCCQSDDERLIVDMKERGFTDREIAKELGMSRERVQNTLKSIYERLQRELSDDKETDRVCSRPDAGHQVLQPPGVRCRPGETRSLGV